MLSSKQVVSSSCLAVMLGTRGRPALQQTRKPCGASAQICGMKEKKKRSEWCAPNATVYGLEQCESALRARCRSQAAQCHGNLNAWHLELSYN